MKKSTQPIITAPLQATFMTPFSRRTVRKVFCGVKSLKAIQRWALDLILLLLTFVIENLINSLK